MYKLEYYYFNDYDLDEIVSKVLEQIEFDELKAIDFIDFVLTYGHIVINNVRIVYRIQFDDVDCVYVIGRIDQPDKSAQIDEDEIERIIYHYFDVHVDNSKYTNSREYDYNKLFVVTMNAIKNVFLKNYEDIK